MEDCNIVFHSKTVFILLLSSLCLEAVHDLWGRYVVSVVSTRFTTAHTAHRGGSKSVARVHAISTFPAPRAIWLSTFNNQPTSRLLNVERSARYICDSDGALITHSFFYILFSWSAISSVLYGYDLCPLSLLLLLQFSKVIREAQIRNCFIVLLFKNFTALFFLEILR